MCKRKQRALLKTDTYSLFSKFIDNSEFIGFLLLKYSNFGDFIRLKQIFYSFGIKIFMPRTKLLKNFLKSNFDKKIFGKLIIIYLSEGIKVVSIKQVLDFLKNNLLLVPLFFYINNKFIYSCNFFNLEFEKKKEFFSAY